MALEKKKQGPVRVKRKKDVAAGVQEKPLTPKELEAYREKLLALRKDLLGDMNKMENGAFDKNSSGELSTMPVHMADIGTDNYEQEFTLGLMDSERKMLFEIDRALRKFVEGDFGICEGTGKQITRARLNAKPYARYTIEFRTMLEKGLVNEPGEGKEKTSADSQHDDDDSERDRDDIDDYHDDDIEEREEREDIDIDIDLDIDAD
ncbi:MAG: hypothetical protein JW745_08740 [Sedimentisphaerales bacterium]|nr:hypothetical protein [Sedimentisphaerales bacterium]MBN2844096.1 hypothetical protein [Sedimentisphaerales bacterium]